MIVALNRPSTRWPRRHPVVASGSAARSLPDGGGSCLPHSGTNQSGASVCQRRVKPPPPHARVDPVGWWRSRPGVVPSLVVVEPREGGRDDDGAARPGSHGIRRRRNAVSASRWRSAARGGCGCDGQPPISGLVSIPPAPADESARPAGLWTKSRRRNPPPSVARCRGSSGSHVATIYRAWTLSVDGVSGAGRVHEMTEPGLGITSTSFPPGAAPASVRSVHANQDADRASIPRSVSRTSFSAVRRTPTTLGPRWRRMREPRASLLQWGSWS